MKMWTVILLFACVQAALSQPSPDTLWTRTYGGYGYDDEASSVQQTSDGGYIVAGCTETFGAGNGDFYLIKTNSQGDTLWTRTYGGSQSDRASSVQQTADGGYVLAGKTGSFGAGLDDFYLVKTDGQGDTLWTRTYGGSNDDLASCIQQTADGGYILVGRTSSFGVADRNLYLVRTNGQGDTLWTRIYGESDHAGGRSVQETADGGYIVAGYTQPHTPGWYDFYLVRTDSQGDTLWTRTYGGEYADEAYSVQQTADGGYVLAGYTRSFGAGWEDFYVVKTNHQGDTLWTRTFGGSYYDEAFSIQQTSDGGYIVVGYGEFSAILADDICVVRMNGQGDILWTRTYGGSFADRAISGLQTSDGGYVLAGYTEPFAEGGKDIYIVKTGPELTTEPPEISLPTEYTLLQNYPNPFNPVTTIRYNVSRTGHVSLKVFDLLGREAAALVQGTIPAGAYSIAWDATNFPSGLYLCRMETGEFAQTRKMVLLK